MAIITAVQIDDALETALLRKMTILEDEVDEVFVGDSGPLSTFSAKIKMAYALGIIGRDTRRDLVIVKNIRNAFAHARRPVRFTTEEITVACAQLMFLNRIEKPEGPDYPPDAEWPPLEPRRIYAEVTGFLAMSLRVWAWEGELPDVPLFTDDFARLIAK